MKNSILYSTLFAAAITFVGCSEAPIESNITPDVATSANTLVAIAPASSQTKISFTDNDAEGIALEWVAGDKFSVYEVDGDWVDDYSISDLESSTFTAVNDNGLTDEFDYIAVYPARESEQATYAEYIATDRTASQTQTGTALDLNTACQMSDIFKAGESVKFQHEKSVITINFSTSDGSAPTKLIFTDSATKSYELNLSSVTAADSYTAYLMVEPVEVSAERNLDFTVAYGDGLAQAYTVVASMSFEPGVRYTAPVGAASTSGYVAIYTVDDLISYLAKGDLGNVTLMNDIDMSGVSHPAVTDDTYAKYLYGTFDGNGYVISNLSISNTNRTNGTALFPGISANGVIKNLTLENPTIYATSYVGAFVGKLMANASIENCTVINGNITAVGQNVGGIVGQCSGTVMGCSYAGSVASEVSNTPANAGGIAGGANSASQFIDCHNSGSVTISHNNAGGIVGQIFSAADTMTTIIGCTNSGYIASSSTATGIGGIAGLCNDDIAIYGCSNSGTIEGITKVGGIAGSIIGGGDVVACSNIGTIGKSDLTTGSTAGIVGEAKAITNVVGCYNSSDFGKPTNSGNIGQITGYINAEGAVITVTDCYFVSADAVSAKGERCDDIAALNAVVGAMNTAIAATNYTAYTFQAGVDDNTLPIIVVTE